VVRAPRLGTQLAKGERAGTAIRTKEMVAVAVPAISAFAFILSLFMLSAEK